MIGFTVPGQPQGPAHQSLRSQAEEVHAVAERIMGDRSPLEGPLSLRVVAYRARPVKPKYTHETVTSDALLYGSQACTVGAYASGILSEVEDGCRSARVWRDDCQVSEVRLRKVWCAEGERARVEVSVYELEEG